MYASKKFLKVFKLFFLFAIFTENVFILNAFLKMPKKKHVQCFLCFYCNLQAITFITLFYLPFRIPKHFIYSQLNKNKIVQEKCTNKTQLALDMYLTFIQHNYTARALWQTNPATINIKNTIVYFKIHDPAKTWITRCKSLPYKSRLRKAKIITVKKEINLLG